MRQRWLSGRALVLHVALVVTVGGCLAAFAWQLRRALGGNDLSWAYTFEWPIFAVLAVIGWWQMVHDDPASVGNRALRRLLEEEGVNRAPAWGVPPAAAAAAEADPEMAAYNRYLAGLAASGRRKSWRAR